MPRKPRVTPNAPDDFKTKLVYFHDIDKESHTFSLNNRLMLVSEDEPGSGYVFGYVLNEPMRDRLGRMMKLENQPLSEKFNFVQVFDAGADNFEFSESHFMTFLMRENHKPNPYPVDKFGPFEAMVCESWEEARHVGENLATRPNTIVLYSQLMVNRDTMVGLIRQRKADWCEADPDIVFDSSAFMRAKKAFPKLMP